MTPQRPRTRIYHAQDLSKGGQIAFSREEAAYFSKVLRLKSGAEVGLFNERDGEWRVALQVHSPREIIGQIGSQVCAAEPNTGPCLAFAPIKKVPLEWILVKATELGVSTLQPVITDHTQAELTRPDRLEVLLKEATEQCERCRIPELMVPLPLADWLAKAGPVLVAVEAGLALGAKTWLANGKPVPANLLVGPEGGFSGKELEHLAQAPHVEAINLGPRILKAETAALSLLTLAQAKAGEFEARPGFRS